MTIRNKILLLIASIAILIGGLGALFFLHGIQEADQIARHEAISDANTLAFEILSFHGGNALGVQDINDYIQKVKEGLHRHVSIVDSAQKIIADTDINHVGRTFDRDPNDEVGLTISDGKTRGFTETDTSSQKLIRYVVMPLDSSNSGRIGALVLEYTPLYNEMIAFTGKNAAHFLIYYLAAIAIAICLGVLLTRGVSVPLGLLKEAAGRIASGDLSARVSYDRSDEFGSLSMSFNEMAAGIESAHQELNTANSDLIESEKRLRILVDAIPDMVFFKDSDSRHLMVNKSLEEILGISADAVLGKDCGAFLSPEVVKLCRRNDEEVLTGHKAVRSEENIRDKDGNERIMDTIKVPLYDEQGKASGLVGISRDITVRRKAEEALRESRETLRTIIENVPT